MKSNKSKDAISMNGMAATSHPLATEVALKILKKGGNAVDAAIAASICLSVVEPNSTSIGGDCFAIVKFEGKNSISYNGSGIAPKKANYDFFKSQSINKIDLLSPHSVTIPGAVHAWKTIHENHGNLDFEQLFLDSINFAENGYRITEKVSIAWAKSLNKLNKYKSTRNLYLKNGKSYKFNEIRKNLPLAKTLKIISQKGPKEFYEGSITKDMVESLNQIGGLHTLEDFSCQSTIKSETLKSNYKDVVINQCPPNGPGITVLLMLKLMEKLKIQQYLPDSLERFHLEAEVTKLCYKIREENIADPDFVNMDISKLLSEENIKNLLNEISTEKCTKIGDLNIPNHPETVYLSVVDKNLNSVSIINSICYSFGSAITSNTSGILFHNRGTNFRIEENHPNCIEGHKRPLHTIIPGLVVNERNETILSYGVMGGQYQPVGQLHIINNIFDYHMTPQQAITFPRAFHFNNIYKLEREIDISIKDNLEKIGHKVEYTNETHGGGQAILIDRKKGNLLGGSDPRKDGYASGY